jgi:hypothetical protein
MVSLAWTVAVLALAGALTSWIMGAWFFAQTLRLLAADRERPGPAWLAIVGWPFALGRLKGAAAAHAAKINKSLVAFFACLMVAIAATSVATNLARVSR